VLIIPSLEVSPEQIVVALAAVDRRSLLFLLVSVRAVLSVGRPASVARAATPGSQVLGPGRVASISPFSGGLTAPTRSRHSAQTGGLVS